MHLSNLNNSDALSKFETVCHAQALSKFIFEPPPLNRHTIPWFSAHAHTPPVENGGGSSDLPQLGNFGFKGKYCACHGLDY